VHAEQELLLYALLLQQSNKTGRWQQQQKKLTWLWPQKPPVLGEMDCKILTQVRGTEERGRVPELSLWMVSLIYRILTIEKLVVAHWSIWFGVWLPDVLILIFDSAFWFPHCLYKAQYTPLKTKLHWNCHILRVLENKAERNLSSLSISLRHREISHSYAIGDMF